MLSTAKRTPLGKVAGSIDYRQGKAQETGLDSGIAKAVTAFQAFHWFSNDATLAEFHRILEPQGRLALMWNDRDDRDPLTSAYHKILSNSAEGRCHNQFLRSSTDILKKTAYFEPPAPLPLLPTRS